MNKDHEGDGGDPPTFTEFLEYILHEDMTGACKEGRQTDRQRERVVRVIADLAIIAEVDRTCEHIC